MNDFIADYMLYAGGNEASPLFHKWAALSTLSAVVSRKIFFDQNYFKLYPNLYVVLVGEPGDGKTTAMSLARSMVQKMEIPVAPPSITLQQISVLMSATNEESKCHLKFVQNMMPMEISHFSFFASEIVTMLSAGGNPQGLIEFFTDIYDRESYEVATKNKGTDFINSPYITMLACMTPEQTGQLLKERLITGGFSRRGIFVWGKRHGTPVPFPQVDPKQEEARVRCLAHLRKVKAFSKEYKLTDCGRNFFIPWYHEKYKQLAMPHTNVFKNWLRTKDMQLIKVSMLLDLSREMSGLLTERLFRDTLAMLDEVEVHLNRVLAGAGKNPLAELAYRIYSRLEEAPDKTLPKKKLITALFEDGSMEDIDKALEYLIRTDVVVRGTAQGQPPIEMLKLLR
jgi:hypothetical protein